MLTSSLSRQILNKLNSVESSQHPPHELSRHSRPKLNCLKDLPRLVASPASCHMSTSRRTMRQRATLYLITIGKKKQQHHHGTRHKHSPALARSTEQCQSQTRTAEILLIRAEQSTLAAEKRPRLSVSGNAPLLQCEVVPCTRNQPHLPVALLADVLTTMLLFLKRLCELIDLRLEFCNLHK
jgi:hypothetical protein